MNVRLTKAQALELDPAKAYLLFLKKGAVSEDDAKLLAKQLHRVGMNNVVVALTDKGAYKIVTVENHLKKQAKEAVAKAKVEAKGKAKT